MLGKRSGNTTSGEAAKTLNHASASDVIGARSSERRTPSMDGQGSSESKVRKKQQPLAPPLRPPLSRCEDSDPIVWTSSPAVTVTKATKATKATAGQGTRKRSSSSEMLRNRTTKPVVVEISDSDSDGSTTTVGVTRKPVNIAKDTTTNIANGKAFAKSRNTPATLDYEDDDSIMIISEKSTTTMATKGTETLTKIPTNTSIITKKDITKEQQNENISWILPSSDDNDEEWLALSNAASLRTTNTTATTTITNTIAAETLTASAFGKSFSAKTSAILADLKRLRKEDVTAEGHEIDDLLPEPRPKKKRKTPPPPNSRCTMNTILSSPPLFHTTSISPSIETESVAPTKPKRTTTKNVVDPEVAAAKEAAKAEKEAARAAKEAEKIRKAAEKEAAAAQKRAEAELASLNKLKSTKTESVKEMIVDISSSIGNTQLGQALTPILENFKCEYHTDYIPPCLNLSPGEKIVKWRRKVVKYWDNEAGMFRALARPEIRDETHILVHLTAKEFMELAVPDMSRLDRHVSAMKCILSPPDLQQVTPIYLIEGLRGLLQRCANAANRQFRAAVTAQMGSPAQATSSSRTPANNPAYTAEVAELALMQLQFHRCLVHETVAPPDSAEWITMFTSNISAIPYKAVQASRGTDTFLGNIKSGANPEETFVRMLQEITRVTVPVANGVVARAGCVKGLVEMFEERGADALSDVRAGQTRSGAPSERKVGSAVSRRIAGVFMGMDPSMDDV